MKRAMVLAGSLLLTANVFAADSAHEHAGHVAPSSADSHAGHVAPSSADSHAGHVAPSSADSHAGHVMPSSADSHAGHTTQPSAVSQASQASSSPKVGKKILYYRNPMGLADTSPTPKKDSMGMDYIPVYEEDLQDGSAVRLNLDKVQKLGVRSELAIMRPISRTIRAVGTVQADERLEQIITLKYDGWIEKLHVDATGLKVRRGQPLMEIYSPELVVVQQEYLAAVKAEKALANADEESRSMAHQLAEGALLRLANWDIAKSQIAELQKSGLAKRTMTIFSPAQGVVMEKEAVNGMRFMSGEQLYNIVDLSKVWLIADIFEQDIALIREGQQVNVTLNAMPGKTFTGKVAFIYPTLSSETRTVKVRIDMPNPTGELRPALYATVELPLPETAGSVVAVPDSAVLDSGSRQVVLVERGEGLYEPRNVKLGNRGDGFTEIREGLRAGEKVVVRANFLIDSEANLKAALGHFAH